MFKVRISRGLFQEQKGLIPSPRWKRAKIGTFGCPVTNGRVQKRLHRCDISLLFQASFEGNYPGLKTAWKKEQNQKILGNPHPAKKHIFFDSWA